MSTFTAPADGPLTFMCALSAADMDLIVRALTARADIYTRVARKAGTVPDYEIASRAAQRHRALAARVRTARAAPRSAYPRTTAAGVEGADLHGQE